MGCYTKGDNMKREGLIQIYTGNGKGKTTAALGLALRAIGHGWRVAFIQFLKGSGYTGELFSTARFGDQWHYAQFGWGCPFSSLMRHGHRTCQKCGQCFRENRDPKHEFASMAFAHAKELAASGTYDLLVMDEISHAIRHNLLPIPTVVEFLKTKPADLEIVMTGRQMAPEVLELADLVTEMHMAKHPFAIGVDSRLGIEY
jgi:cob(I)alamin adenosyltransferase